MLPFTIARHLLAKLCLFAKSSSKKVRLVRAFKREETAVMKATRALESVHLKVPDLLPGSNMKFLELEVSSRSVSGAIVSEMPPVALITA